MSITGLYYLIRFHPYWSREARRQLGVGSVLTVAIAQFVCSLPIAFLTPVGFLWPFLLIGGFVLGTVIGIFLCLQWRIIHLAITRRTGFPLAWLSFQLLGLALVASAILVSVRVGGSVLDGITIYLLVAGILTILTSTILYTPKQKEPNQPPQPTAASRRG